MLCHKTICQDIIYYVTRSIKDKRGQICNKKNFKSLKRILKGEKMNFNELEIKNLKKNLKEIVRTILHSNSTHYSTQVEITRWAVSCIEIIEGRENEQTIFNSEENRKD